MSHVIDMSESCEWVMSSIWVSHVNESCHRYEWVMWMSHVIDVSESCEWVMSWVRLCACVLGSGSARSDVSHIWMSHVTDGNKSSRIMWMSSFTSAVLHCVLGSRSARSAQKHHTYPQKSHIYIYIYIYKIYAENSGWSRLCVCVVISEVWYVTYMDESFHGWESVTSQMWVSHVTDMNESCHECCYVFVSWWADVRSLLCLWCVT